MKRKIKIEILILIIFTLLIFTGCKDVGDLAGAIVPVPASADQQQSYIEDLKLAGAYWDRYACNATDYLNQFFSNSYNNYSYRRVQDFNLNRDCGTTTDCIYLYESRTYDKSKAITNIISVCSDNESFNYLVYDQYGIEYEVVGGIRINGWNSSVSRKPIFDLNMGAGGKYIYIYVTKDTRLYSPITQIEILNYYKSFGYDSGWYNVCDKSDIYKTQDFNEGAGGSKVYINFSNLITGWEIYTLHLVDWDVNGVEQYKDVKLELKDKVMTEEILSPFVEKDEYSHFAGYSYNGGEMVQVGDEILYDNLTIKAEWYYDIVLDRSLFGLENIVMNYVQKASELPKQDIKGYHMKGWHFENEDTITINTWLNHGGTLVPLMERAYIKDFDEFKFGFETMKTIEPNYLRLTFYELVNRNNDHAFIKLGYDTALYLKNLKYENWSIVPIQDTKELITTTIDYSSLSDEEKANIELHRQFLLLADIDTIQNTIDYYSNEGKEESIIDEVIISLCENELARRN